MGDVHALRETLMRVRAPEPPVLIFAGNLGQAHEVARSRGLKKGTWRYVTRLEHLQTYRGPESCLVLITASWYGRVDHLGEMGEILGRLREADLTSEYVRNH